MSAFRTGLFIGCVLALAGCAHSDLKAPCGPLALSYSNALEIPEPFKTMDMQMHVCGPARPVNDIAGQSPTLPDGQEK